MLWTVPTVKIEPNGVTVTNTYYSDQDTFKRNTRIYNNLFGTDEKTYSTFSIGSQRRLKRAFLLLHSISKKQTVYDELIDKKVTFTLNIIHLTLSANQGIYTDKDIKYQLLNDFLTRLRNKKGLKNYIWRAEPQENGNLHFHIICNQYFNKTMIRDTWNNVQRKLGFINLFNQKYHHNNPPSSRIESIRHIENAQKYVGKYIQKMKDEYRDIEGKYWDCSSNLKPSFKCRIECEGKNIDDLNTFEFKHNDRLYSSDHFKFYSFSHSELLYYLPDTWLQYYKTYLDNIKQPPLKQPQPRKQKPQPTPPPQPPQLSKKELNNRLKHLQLKIQFV